MRIRWSAFAAVVLAGLVTIVGASGVAAAAEPWWRVATISAPASPNDSEAMVVLDVGNLGDATAGGVLEENLSSGKTPITVVDQLPAGVSATQTHIEGGGASLNQFGAHNYPSLAQCAIEEQTVTCHYGIPVRPYEHIVIDIMVKVESGAGRGLNEVSVSGGGAATLQSRKALALEDPPAHFGAQSYELTSEEEGGVPNTQAGSHPFQLTTTLVSNTQAVYIHQPGTVGPLVERESGPEVQPIALTKDLRFNLPAGLIGNPVPLPKCSLHDFTTPVNNKILCPNNTVVGVATPIVMNFQATRWVPLLASTPLYSLEPSYGEPAKFGFQTTIGPVVLDTSVRTGGDYGVVITVPNITEGLAFIGTVTTFWGVPDDSRHDNSRNQACLITEDQSAISGGPEPSCPVSEKPQPLLIMPTACEGAPRTSVEMDSWSQVGAFTEPFAYTFQNGAGESFSEDGCNRLNFEPSIKVAPDGQQASTPSGLTVDVHVPQEASLNPTGLAESSVRDTTVTLPAGVGLNPAGADGLSSCGLGEVGLDSPAEQSCHESAKVGTVEIHTPLLPNPLVGAAYLAEQDANPFGSLVALYIVVKDPVSGVIVKLAGEVKPDPVTGQLVSTFEETPELPFEDLSLHFFGGSGHRWARLPCAARIRRWRR